VLVEEGKTCVFLLKKPEGKNPPGRPRSGGRIILKRTLKLSNWRA
jgi:hypothetical protein